jgi:hypothetical protein
MTFGTGESLAQENFVEWSMSLDNESSTKHVSSGRIENFLDITRKDNDDAAMLALFRSKKGKGDSTINISVDQGAMNLSNQIGEQLREAREEDANASKITAEQMTVRLCSIDDVSSQTSGKIQLSYGSLTAYRSTKPRQIGAS